MSNQYKYEVILGQPEVERYFNNLKQKIESMIANEKETKFYFKIKKNKICLKFLKEICFSL